MMKFGRYALVVFMISFAVACGKKFQVKSIPLQEITQEKSAENEKKQQGNEDIGQFYRVKRGPKMPSIQQPQKVKMMDKQEYKIERERLQFSNVSYEFKEGHLFLRGQVLLNYQLENFEMNGKVERDLVDLKLTDPNSPFRDRLKARATCYSVSRDEKSPCQRFFVDFYYYDQGVFYTDQLIPKMESSGDENKVDEKKEEPASLEEVIENDEVGASAPGFFSVQNDQDILELYPELPSASPGQSLQQPPEKNPSPQPAPGSPQKPPPQSPSAKSPVKKPSRPTNQAIGGAKGEENSRLQNASDLLEAMNQLGKNAGFRVLSQENKRYYATWDMVQFIKKIGAWVRVSFPNQILSVRDISKKEGGQLGSHKSHKVGLDADIAYFTKNKDKTKIMTNMVDIAGNQVSKDLMLDEQLKLFKYMISTNEVNVIFVDHVIKTALCKKATVLGEVNGDKDNPLTVKTLNRLVADYGKEREHATHFHLRLFCGSYNRTCTLPNLEDQGLGCEN